MGAPVPSLARCTTRAGMCAGHGAAHRLPARARPTACPPPSHAALQDLAFVQAMGRRIDAAHRQLDGHLEVLLTRALQQKAWPAVTQCLHALLELGDAGRAAAALRAVVVAPVVAGAIARAQQGACGVGGGFFGGGLVLVPGSCKACRAHDPGAWHDRPSAAPAGPSPPGALSRCPPPHTHAAPAGPSPPGALSAVLGGLLDELQAEAGPLLGAILAPGSVLNGVDVLGAGVLAEVSQQLADKMPGEGRITRVLVCV